LFSQVAVAGREAPRLLVEVLRERFHPAFRAAQPILTSPAFDAAKIKQKPPIDKAILQTFPPFRCSAPTHSHRARGVPGFDSLSRST
jgi:hypothetical protein